MAQLAIKGHQTRGKEVIEILEMLGGNNPDKLIANFDYLGYFIGKETRNIYHFHLQGFDSKTVIIFTLEEFLEKFPYKIGDKVSSKYLKNYEVSKMEWESVNNRVIYKLQGMGWYSADELQPYKEETMEENLTIQDIRDNNAEWLLNKLREIPAEGTLRTISYLYDELHKPQYPKTYKECCEVVGAQSTRHWIYTIKDKIDYPHEIKIINHLDALRKLLICRDAYLKKASERMKLGNPWEPDWTISEYKFTIVEIAGIVVKSVDICNKHILAFPTEEMRDAFYENFKDLIEACKELL